jgi:hypothetical protein
MKMHVPLIHCFSKHRTQRTATQQLHIVRVALRCCAIKSSAATRSAATRRNAQRSHAQRVCIRVFAARCVAWLHYKVQRSHA